MTLQSSGIIKLTQIAAEYSDAKPHKLKEFYGKPGLPASGRIDFTDFYGKSNVVPEQVISRVGEVDVSKLYMWTAATATPIIIPVGGVNFRVTEGNAGTPEVFGFGISAKIGYPKPPAGTKISIALSGMQPRIDLFWDPTGGDGSGTFAPAGGAQISFLTNSACVLTIWYTPN